jgi:hypothetical protein
MQRCAALVACGLLVGVTVRAHHSVLDFDGSRGMTLRGVVVDVVWKYPHAYVAVDVQEGPERGRRWLVESESPVVLERLGWTRTSIRLGDRLLAIGAPHRRGDRVMRCQSVTTADGMPLRCYPERTQ